MQANRSNSRDQASNAGRAENAQAAKRKAEVQQTADKARVAMAKSLGRQADREAAQSAGSKDVAGTSTRTVKALRTTSNQPPVITGDSSGFVDKPPTDDSINRPPTESRPSLEEREDQANAPSPEQPVSTDSSSGTGTENKTPKPIGGTDGDDIQTLSQNANGNGLNKWSGQSGDDFLFVNKGTDSAVIRGSAGTDKVMFEGSSADYTVEASEGLFPSLMVTEKSTGITHKVQGFEQLAFGTTDADDALMIGTDSRDVILNDASGGTISGGNGDDIYIANPSSSSLDVASLETNYVDLGSGINAAFISKDASSQFLTSGGGDAAAVNVTLEGNRDDYEIEEFANYDGGTLIAVTNKETGVLHTLTGSSVSFSFEDTSTISQSIADASNSRNGMYLQNSGWIERDLMDADPANAAAGNQLPWQDQWGTEWETGSASSGSEFGVTYAQEMASINAQIAQAEGELATLNAEFDRLTGIADRYTHIIGSTSNPSLKARAESGLDKVMEKIFDLDDKTDSVRDRITNLKQQKLELLKDPNHDGNTEAEMSDSETSDGVVEAGEEAAVEEAAVEEAGAVGAGEAVVGGLAEGALGLGVVYVETMESEAESEAYKEEIESETPGGFKVKMDHYVGTNNP